MNSGEEEGKKEMKAIEKNGWMRERETSKREKRSTAS